MTSYNCTKEQLGLEGDPKKAEFFTPHPGSKSFIDLYQKKFICAKPEEMFIYGDFTTGKARQLNVQLKKCRGHRYCESEANINKYFSGKYLIILMNQVRFMSEGFEEKATIKESRMFWLTINTQFTQTLPYKLTASSLQLQDKAFNFDALTQEERDNVFRLEASTPFSYEKDKDTTMDITFERNLDLQ